MSGTVTRQYPVGCVVICCVVRPSIELLELPVQFASPPPFGQLA